MSDTEPTSPKDSDDSHHSLPRHAQWVRRWLYGREPSATSVDLRLTDLDGKPFRVTASPVAVAPPGDGSGGPFVRDLTGCWSIHGAPVPDCGFIGARTSWENYLPSVDAPPAGIVWVMGDALHLAAIDAIEDTLVVRPGTNLEETVEKVTLLNEGAFSTRMPHVLVRTHHWRPSAKALEREVEAGRALARALGCSGLGSMATLWRPTPARVRIDELLTLVHDVERFLEYVAREDGQLIRQYNNEDFAFQRDAGW